MSTHPEVPGEPTQTGTAFLEMATATIQNFAPINKIHQHLCAYVLIFSSSSSSEIYDVSINFVSIGSQSWDFYVTLIIFQVSFLCA
jgi:hypothetical protein